MQRIALPITIGSVRYPGIKIHAAKQIHEAVLTTFGLSPASPDAAETAITGGCSDPESRRSACRRLRGASHGCTRFVKHPSG